MKKMIKKVIAPVLVITVLFTVLRPFCIQYGKCNYFLLLLLMGIPFGIGKMCVWMVPRGFDLGGTLAVWTMNFLIGGLIGSVVLLAMIGQAIIYLSVFLKYHSASGRLFQFYRNFCGTAENDGRRTDRRGFLGVRTYGLCDAASDHSVNGNGAGIHDRTGLRFCQKCERGSYNSVSVYHCGDIYRIEPHAQSGKGDPAIPISDPGIQQCAVYERYFFL